MWASAPGFSRHSLNGSPATLSPGRVSHTNTGSPTSSARPRAHPARSQRERSQRAACSERPISRANCGTVTANCSPVNRKSAKSRAVALIAPASDRRRRALPARAGRTVAVTSSTPPPAPTAPPALRPWLRCPSPRPPPRRCQRGGRNGVRAAGHPVTGPSGRTGSMSQLIRLRGRRAPRRRAAARRPRARPRAADGRGHRRRAPGSSP